MVFREIAKAGEPIVFRTVWERHLLSLLLATKGSPIAQRGVGFPVTPPSVPAFGLPEAARAPAPLTALHHR
jgi:hypothetical protein